MRRAICIFLLFQLMASLAHAQQRHALVIGIGQYEDAAWGRIHGDSDIYYAVKMLKVNHFNDIITLKNEEATKKSILSAFDTLQRNCKLGDKVYIQFSGHGQQVTDVDGDEENGYDEAWIPYDARPLYKKDVYEGENHLIDDEVNRLLSIIKAKIGPSGQIVVVVDACHSGDSTREPGDDAVARGFDEKFEIPKRNPARKEALKEDWITISACKSHQINWEIAKPSVGKLTWCLYNLRWILSGLSNDALEEKIRQIMQENPGPLEQTPDFTGCLGVQQINDLFR